MPQVSVVLEPPVAQDSAPLAETPAALDPSGDGDWPMFHADAARRGLSAAPPLRSPVLRWKALVGHQSWLNSPLVVGSAVVVPSCGAQHNAPDTGDAVIALDLGSGRELWRAALPNDANGAAATKERVFVTSDDGHLHALELKTGHEVWKQPGAGRVYSAPLLFRDVVVVGDAGGHVRAYALATGEPRFDVALGGAIRGGAAADAETIYVSSQGGDLAALAADGRVLWKTRVDHPPWDGRGPARIASVYAAPLLSDDAVIVAYVRDTTYRDRPALSAFDKRTGKLRWRARAPGEFGNIRATPALVAGALIWAEPYSGDIVAISVASGRQIFRRSAGACYFPHWAAGAAAGDVAYVQRFDGVLHALGAVDGAPRWRFYVGDSRRAGAALPRELETAAGCTWEVPVGHAAYSPVAIARDGTVLAGTSEGYLYALGEAPP